MRGLNKVTLIGHLGKDPELRALDSNVSVASFSLATTESYTKDGQKIENTEWHNITLWRGLAEVADKYLKKGDAVYIEGRLRTRDWMDKENVKRYTTEIVATNMIMLGGKRDGGSAPAPTQAPAESGNTNSAPAQSQPQAAQANNTVSAPAEDAFEDDGSDLPF